MSEENTELKVYNLIAENVLNLDVIDITPTENTIILSGNNGEGKTNILKSIEFALSGKALKATTEPVRHGERSGDIILDLGKFVVKRHFTNTTSSLEVLNKEGMVFKSPQAMLDSLRGNISFDPMEFAGLPDKKQKEILLELIDLPIDLDELDKERKTIYDKRTLVNRDVVTFKGQIEGIPDRLEIPDDELSAADVMDEMKAATEQIAANNNLRTGLDSLIEKRDRIKEDQDRINTEIIALQDKAEQIKLDLTTHDQSIATTTDIVAELVDPDLEEFKCKMDDITEINQHVREKQERRRLFSLMENEEEKSRGLTNDIKDIDALKSKTIQDANMPVPGLGFDENGVTFGDIPLSQRSKGEQNLISMSIGMALNPKLKVIWMKDASLLDHNSMEDVKAMAAEHGYQLWLEIVSDDKNMGIHIKEGKVIS